MMLPIAYLLVLVNLSVGVPSEDVNDEIQMQSKNSIDAAREYMVTLFNYESMESQNRDDITESDVDQYAKAKAVISFAKYTTISNPKDNEEAGAILFDTESTMNTNKLSKASLRLYFDADQKKVSDNNLNVSVYQLSETKGDKQALTSQEVDASSSQWNKFDITKAMQDWIDDPTSNNGLFVECKTSNDEVKTLEECGLVGMTTETKHNPFIVAYYETSNDDNQIDERFLNYDMNAVSSDDFTADSSAEVRESKSSCGRTPFTIKFSDGGWNWVLLPKSLDIGMCAGACRWPYHHKMQAIHHSHMQSVTSAVSGKHPDTCCTPKTYKPTDLLTEDEKGNHVKKPYNTIIVDTCSCE